MDRQDFVDDVAKRLFVECQDARASYDTAEELWAERERRARVKQAEKDVAYWERHEHAVVEDVTNGEGHPYCTESECSLERCESHKRRDLAKARYVLDHDGPEPPKPDAA